MSKYKKLWLYLKDNCMGTETLTFDEIYRICGATVDFSFKDYESELRNYGISIMKVNLNNRTVLFSRNA